ncbi:MAG: hypothetical protein K1X72_26945 [Pyrinomonadaceae bacterium]|nr:hypothetical protein [Pyrinomonadaceae bacterium]
MEGWVEDKEDFGDYSTLKKGEQVMSLATLLSILVCVGLLIQIWLTLVITSILPGLNGSFARSFAETFYWFTLPHLMLLLVTLVAVVIQAKRRTYNTFIFSAICLVCSLPTSLYPTSVWSGVGDGWGMGWIFFLGGASLLNIVIGIPMLYIAHRNYPSNK